MRCPLIVLSRGRRCRPGDGGRRLRVCHCEYVKRVARPSIEALEPAWIPRVLASRDHLSLRAYGLAVWAVVLAGIVLRIAQYLYDRSLWMDESFLALNLIDKPFSALFGQLSFNQAAPPGFLLVQRADITLFGKSEYAVRLFPLVCGISSILLFKRVASALLGRSAALIALALFSLSDGLIYYSSEVKQYSADVAVTLLIAVGGLDLSSRRPSRGRAIVWGLIGSAAVWFSHAAAFGVAAVVLVLLAADIAHRRWQVVKPAAAVLGVWLASLAVALVYERFTVRVSGPDGEALIDERDRETRQPHASTTTARLDDLPASVCDVRRQKHQYDRCDSERGRVETTGRGANEAPHDCSAARRAA